MAEPTPMVRQYLEVKSKYKDAILFYRLGDFYEMFFDDAVVASKALNLTLTSRNKNVEDSIPLCGIPHHSAQSYINKLTALGHKVAICEQVEDPKFAKGIVKREVVNVITPGLKLDPDALEGKSFNYLVALWKEDEAYSLALTDISTGTFRVIELPLEKMMIDELTRVDPSEVLVFAKEKNQEWTKILTRILPQARITFRELPYYDEQYAEEIFTKYYQALPDGAGLKKNSLLSAGLILDYLTENRLLKDQILSRPQAYYMGDSMVLDEPAKKNLELIKTLGEGRSHGSLFWLLDKAQTSMGSRTIKKWLLYPLIAKEPIEERLNAVEELKEDSALLNQIQNCLKSIADLERIANRVLAGQANARDLLVLATSLKAVEPLTALLYPSRSTLLKKLSSLLDPASDLTAHILKTLSTEPPLSIKEGGMIREGVNENLDALKDIETNGKTLLSEMEARERERTGITSLKIRYNQVFGYYIEITHAHKDKIPSDYIRKQTLTTAERYITPELKDYEEKILGAAEKICAIENEIFLKLRATTANQSERIKNTAALLGEIDALLSLATVARDNRYSKPEIVHEKILDIKESRHPLVEALYREETFVPNDVYLDDSCHLIIITGPNMAGKSTVMRQTALIILLAQIGSFVPAKSAKIGITDRIFTRIGANDNLQKGQSTFMVEMVETAQILSQATDRSFILLDEIGRGTSTFDGLSIAWAVAETIHDTLKARTLFATHYHELTDLAEEKTAIRNYHMAIRETKDGLVFLRELKKGGSNRSYGLHVASMAGLPLQTIKRAKEILAILETKDLQFKSETQKHTQQPSLFSVPSPQKPDPIIEELRNLSVNQMSPLQALNFLDGLIRKINS